VWATTGPTERPRVGALSEAAVVSEKEAIVVAARSARRAGNKKPDQPRRSSGRIVVGRSALAVFLRDQSQVRRARKLVQIGAMRGV
jgi:hypothetical protein